MVVPGTRPRLAVVAPTGLMSGSEAVLLRLVRHALAAGWEVRAACPSGPLVAAMTEAGAAVTAIAELKLPAGPRLVALARFGWRQLSTAPTLRALGRSSDVMLVNGVFALPSVRLARASCPVAWLVHDVIRKRSWMPIVRFGRPAVTLAIAVSEAVGASVTVHGIPVRMIRNGTPWPVDPIPDSPPDVCVVGCTALLTSWKGQDVLLDAIAVLPRDVRVELVGGEFPRDAPYVASLRERSERPDLRGRVTFVGPVHDPLLRMRSWSVAVSASVEPEAGGPLAVLEAMSVGLPVVGTDHGSVPEVLDGAGLLVPTRDARALAAAVERLLSEPDLWRRCHEAGPRAVASGLALDRQLDFLLAVLADLRQEDVPGRDHGPSGETKLDTL